MKSEKIKKLQHLKDSEEFAIEWGQSFKDLDLRLGKKDWIISNGMGANGYYQYAVEESIKEFWSNITERAEVIYNKYKEEIEQAAKVEAASILCDQELKPSDDE